MVPITFQLFFYIKPINVTDTWSELVLSTPFIWVSSSTYVNNGAAKVPISAEIGVCVQGLTSDIWNYSFIPHRADQDPWICKYDNNAGYDHIATHVDDVIISAKSPYKYMHEIEMHFKVREITDYPNYYLGNDLIQVGNLIHLSSNNYVNEILK